MMKKISRRSFIKNTAGIGLGGLLGAGVMPHLMSARVNGANERLTLGYIGVGGFGNQHLGRGLRFRSKGSVDIAAVCEIDSTRLAAAVERVGEGCTAYSDYRELLERKDIDAVVISSPDHWHAMQTIHACEAGKHVYVEKPASCTVDGGRAMVEASRRNNRVVQVGSQARSAEPAHQVATYLRNGMLGKVNRVICWHEPNPVGGLTQGEDPPPELDWDRWLGPLSMRPFVPHTYHPSRFRWIMESGGGNIRDRGAHVMSIALWCLGADAQAPVRIEATGDPRPDRIWDVPAEMNVVYTFKNPDWELVWDQKRERSQAQWRGGSGFGIVFEGEKGYVDVSGDGAPIRGWEPIDEEIHNYRPPADGVVPYRMAKHNEYNMDHTEEWFQAIRENRRPSMDIEIAHRVATLNNLGNLSYVAGRKIDWDGETEQIIGDPELTHRLIWKTQREPYL